MYKATASVMINTLLFIDSHWSEDERNLVDFPIALRRITRYSGFA